MINVAKITKAIQDRLVHHPNLQDVKSVVRSEMWNDDPAKCPWIGIYRNRVDYEPRTLGHSAQAWRSSTLQIDVVVQHAHLNDGEKTEDELEELVAKVFDAILENRQFSDHVATTVRFSVDYDYQPKDTATLDFQAATITMEMEVRTG